jgi:hypothetical protein
VCTSFSQMQVFMVPYRDKKVVGVFVHLRFHAASMLPPKYMPCEEENSGSGE